MIHFSTGKKHNVIWWYFSDISTKEEGFRELAWEAVAVFNRAFEIIT